MYNSKRNRCSITLLAVKQILYIRDVSDYRKLLDDNGYKYEYYESDGGQYMAQLAYLSYRICT